MSIPPQKIYILNTFPVQILEGFINNIEFIKTIYKGKEIRIATAF
jgi:hypothetical protein